MQIRSSSGNGTILESIINKVLTKNQIIAAAKVASDLEGDIGAEAVITAGLINAQEAGIELEDSDLDYIIAKVCEGEKLEKKAQYLGKALRGLGKGMGGVSQWVGNLGQGVKNLGQGVKNVGQGAWNAAKQVGQGIANLPQAVEQKGYQMEQKNYQDQVAKAQGISQSMSQQYNALQRNLANIGQAASAIKSGPPNPATMNTIQGNIKAMMEHLQQMNQSITTLIKLKGASGPAPVAPVTPQQAVNRALPKAPAQPQTLSY